MSHHPCAGHACDHCYLCDVVGVCCSTVAAAVPTDTTSAPDRTLRRAVVQAAGEHVGLAELIRADQVAGLLRAAVAPLALPAGPSIRDELRATRNLETGQEVERVLAPGHQRR